MFLPRFSKCATSVSRLHLVLAGYVLVGYVLVLIILRQFFSISWVCFLIYKFKSYFTAFSNVCFTPFFYISSNWKNSNYSYFESFLPTIYNIYFKKIFLLISLILHFFHMYTLCPAVLSIGSISSYTICNLVFIYEMILFLSFLS